MSWVQGFDSFIGQLTTGGAMSYNEAMYRVEFKSGKAIHIYMDGDSQEVLQECKKDHKEETVKAIYKEVYILDEEKISEDPHWEEHL